MARITVTSNSHFAVPNVVDVPEEDTGELSSDVKFDDRVAKPAAGANDDPNTGSGDVGLPVTAVEDGDATEIAVDAADEVRTVVDVAGREDEVGGSECVVMVYLPIPSVRVLALAKSFPASPSLANFLFLTLFCFLLFLSLLSLSFLSPFLDFRLLFAASSLFWHCSSPSPC